MSIATKRKQIENLIFGVFDRLDKTGENSKVYREALRGMNDEAFFKWAKNFTKDTDSVFTLEVLPFKNEPKFEDIEEAGKFLDMPFEEYIYFRDELDGKKVRSAHKVPVFYVYTKRLQQMVSKKTAVSTSIKTRSAITNQVTNDSKVARNSMAESFGLITAGNINTLKEMLGPRAGNAGQKRRMYANIARDSFVKMSDLKQSDSVFEKPELNALDAYLLGMGLKSNLLTDDNKLLGSMKSKTD